MDSVHLSTSWLPPNDSFDEIQFATFNLRHDSMYKKNNSNLSNVSSCDIKYVNTLAESAYSLVGSDDKTGLTFPAFSLRFVDFHSAILLSL